MLVDEFVETNLTDHLSAVKRLGYIEDGPLGLYDQVVIHAYSSDYYLPVNRYLRTGDPTLANAEFLANFSQLLTEALKKLPICKTLVYRGVQLSATELATYYDAAKTGETIVEPFFVSTSKSRAIADRYGRVLFRIVSRSGRDITKLSAHKAEEELLFMSGTTFLVRKVDVQQDSRLVITMKEV